MKIGDSKPKKDDDFMDEDEVELEDAKHSHDDEARKKMFRFMIIIVGVAVGLLLILFLISVFSKPRSYTYEDVENIMQEAAKSYFSENPNQLPDEDGSIVEIDSSNLAIAGKMKALSEYTGEVLCTGNVQVTKSGSEYLYVPYLNCGEIYNTVELYNVVLSQSNMVSSGYGLYATNGGYAFRGEDVNNYVQLDNALWRIVKITSNNNLVLITNESVGYTQPWDNRYNQDNLYEAGINQYGASRVKEFLERVYTNPSEKDGELILSDADKAKMVSYSVCTGKRSVNSETRNNIEECSQVLQNQKMGLLTLSDYLYASVDPNCKSAATKSCKNYNYLAIKEDWWLATANKDDSSSVYSVSRTGNVVSESAAHYASVRPVIYLNNRVLFKSGKGTLDEPYLVR